MGRRRRGGSKGEAGLRRHARALGIVGFIALALSLGVSGCDGEADEASAPLEPAPGFALPRLHAGLNAPAVRLEEHRGKTVILDFWATWCKPCEFQVPELNAFFDAHRSDSDVALYGISVDLEGPEVVAPWVAEKGVRYPILLEGDPVARSFGLEGFPAVVVVGPAGMIRSRHAGLIQQSELEEILSQIRAEAVAPSDPAGDAI